MGNGAMEGVFCVLLLGICFVLCCFLCFVCHVALFSSPQQLLEQVKGHEEACVFLLD